jgi:hypothetical protein
MNFLRLYFSSFLLLFVVASNAQVAFTKKNQLLTPLNHYSGVAIAVMDMNADGRDDIVRMNQGFQVAIEYQTTPDAAFQHFSLGNLPNSQSQWGMCVGDFDNNGWGDILTGGSYDGIKFIKANADGTQYTTQNLTTPTTFVQGVNMADINNDGFLDAFVCHDDGVARIFSNNGNGLFAYQSDWIDLTTVPTSDNSGNYGSVWSDVDNDNDLDLYIAKCRQGVNSPSDPRRINQLFLNNGDGTYTQDITNASGLRIGAQSWTADFGDIDNDGDFDCFITNHDVSSQILENDGSGHFTDISGPAGLLNAVTGEAIQGVFTDFDNDGFVDILVAGSAQFYFHNNGNKTFTKVTNPFDVAPMESYALGDLNYDGFMDIYAGYANIYTSPSTRPDVLWMNNGNDNHFAGIQLRGVNSNRNAVGAKVVLYSALGQQVREVRSGQSYGISNTFSLLFGLDTLTQVDSALIYWPSGLVQKIQPTVDQYITVIEGNCTVTSISTQVNGNTTLCAGDSLSLNFVDSFEQYAWNTGDTSAQISVTTSGTYWATVTISQGCTMVSSQVNVVFNPEQTPVISALGETVFCSGGSVVLTASPSSSYLWNTGATTQSIVVDQLGSYQVTTQGLCESFTSAALSVDVLAAAIPVVSNDTITIGDTLTLFATGYDPIWYENATDTFTVGSGNPLIINDLTENTTYWVANKQVFGQPNQSVGMVNHQGGMTSDNSFNGAIIFDCFEPFTLAKAKVYTSKAGVRRIVVENATGNILDSISVFIPVGTTVIDLNLDIPVGEDLSLTTDEVINQSSIQTSGPQLRRSNEGVAYPYSIANVVTLKNSNFNSDRYYYFYDWEVAFKGYECISERVPVTIVVQPMSASQEPAWAQGVRLFPNPTHGYLQVEMPDETTHATLTLKNAQGQVVLQQNIKGSRSTMQMDTQPKGVYFIEINTTKGSVMRKVIVE